MTATRVQSDEPFGLAVTAAASLRQSLAVDEYEVAVILGSGWAAAADQLGQVVAEVELSAVPGFPRPQVEGHRNLARSLSVGGRSVLVLGGRTHLYEGSSVNEVVHGVRTAQALGCTTAVLTNAAGAINPSFEVGAPVLITDQLNLTGQSPMAGPEPPPGHPGRFCDMTNAFSPRLRSTALEHHPTVKSGVYSGLLGGAYETPAEVRMLASLGADLVGMSTVLEVIAARHLHMEVLGVSLVTNMAAGVTGQPLAHAEVLDVAAGATDVIVALIRDTIAHL